MPETIVNCRFCSNSYPIHNFLRHCKSKKHLINVQNNPELLL